MCRFAAMFSNEPILVADILTKPRMSLIRQSYAAQERQHPVGIPGLSYQQSTLNGDGYGIACTTRTAATSVTSSSAPVVSSRSQPTTKKPCVFTSLKPAWNDRNLSRLAEQVSSKCVFAHIRAAGPGSPVSDDACHPFEARGLLFMHNGMLADFEKHTRTLLGMLSEEGFRVALEHNCIDSAVAFGLYLTMLEELQEVEVTASSSTAAITHAYSADTLAAALKKTIDVLNRLGGPKEPSLLNFVVSDGKCILATRAGVGGDGASLYVCTGSNWVQEKLKKQCPNKPKARQQRLVEKQWKTSLGENTEDFAMENFEARPSVVIIASEPLSADRHDWSATTILGHNAAAVLALRIFRDRYLLSSSKVDLRVWDLHAALLAVEQSGISLATTSCTDHVHGPGPASSSTGTGGGAAVSFLSRTSSTPAGGGTTATAPPAPHRDVGRMKRTSSKVVEKNQNVACLVCFRFQPMQGQLLTVGRCDEGGREEGKFRVILGFSSCNLYELSIDLDCIRKQTSGRSHTIRFVTLSCDTTVREKYPLWKESFADVGAARTSPLLSKDRRLKALDCGRSVGGAGEELHNSDTVATLSTTTGGGDTTIGVDQGTAAARNGHCRYSKPPLEDIYSSLAGGPGADYRIPETYCSDPEPVTQLTGTASPRAVVVPQLLNASRSIMIARSPTTPVGSAGTPRNKSGRTSAMPKECQSLQFITQHRSCVYQVSYLPRNRMAVSVGGDGVLQVHYVSDQSAAGSPAAVRDQRQGGDGPIYCAAVCVNFEVRKTTSSSRLAAANGGQIVVGPGGKRVADSKDLPVGVPAAGDSGNSAGLKMTSTSQNTKRRFSYDGIYDVEQKDDHDEQSYTTLEHLSSYGTSRVHRHALENQNCAGAGGDEDVVDELPPLPQAISGDSFIHNGNSSPIPRDLSGVNPPSRPMNVGLQQLQQDLEARFSAAPEDEENSFPRSPPDFRLNVLEEDGLLSSGITEPEAAGRAEVENKDGRSTATTAHEHQPEVAPVVASPPHAIAKGRAGGLCAGASQEDFFVTGDESGKIKLWRVRNGELAFLKELPNNYVGLGAQASSSSRSTYDSRVLSLCLLRENLLIAGRGDGAVDLYDLYRCKLVERKYIGGSLFATSALSLPQQMTGQTPCQCIRRINEDRFCCVSNFGVLLFEVLGEGAKTSLQPTISSRKAAAMVPTAADGPDARLAQHLRGEMQNLSRGRAGRAPHHSEGDGVDAALETTTQVEELPEPSSRGPNVKIRFLHVRTTFEERIGDREQDHEATEISNSFRTDLMYDDKAAFLSSVAETLRRRSGKKIIILSSSPAGLKFVIGGTVSASGGDRPLHDRRRILLHTNCASPIDELLEMLASFSLSDSEQRKDDTAVEVTLVVDDGTWQEWGAPDADEHNVDRSGTAFPANAEDLDHQNFFTRLIYFAPNVDDEEVANATWTGRKLMMETSGGGPGLFMLQAKGIEELLEGLARLSGVAKVLSVHDSRALVMLVRSCECDRDKLEQEGLLTARPVKLPGLLQDNWSTGAPPKFFNIHQIEKLRCLSPEIGFEGLDTVACRSVRGDIAVLTYENGTEPGEGAETLSLLFSLAGGDHEDQHLSALVADNVGESLCGLVSLSPNAGVFDIGAAMRGGWTSGACSLNKMNFQRNSRSRYTCRPKNWQHFSAGCFTSFGGIMRGSTSTPDNLLLTGGRGSCFFLDRRENVVKPFYPGYVRQSAFQEARDGGLGVFDSGASSSAGPTGASAATSSQLVEHLFGSYFGLLSTRSNEVTAKSWKTRSDRQTAGILRSRY
eukprot:g5784.t1